MPATYKKIQIDEIGPPEVMHLVEETAGAPGPGEVFIRQEAIGVDYIDTQMRSGLMPLNLPSGLGFSAVGTVEAVGAGVDHVAAGDRVAYHYSVPGSYAEARIVPATRVFRLPDQGVDAEIAAGALFRGVTAWYLANRLRAIKPGDFVLVHAAAGGVGLILIQWLKHLGAEVIGTVESREKIAVLRDYGCAHPVLLTEEDFVARVKEITGGKGVSVVYESIGRETFERSLDCAARFGLVVSFGWPSGDVEPISLAHLRNKGSLFVTRPTISHYAADDDDFRAGATALFDLIARKIIRVKVGNSYPLADAPKAHDDLVNQRTLGSVVLTA